jgi:dipeptidyl aminopeptidase/acylaminoacyl peptidase
MLFAPPLDFETDQLNAELNARTPDASDYALEEEIIEGSFTYHIVSYTVDGLKIYGILRFPTAAGEGDCPVLLWGHGGAGVANMYGLNWFTDFVGDSEMLDQFFVAIAASRGETVWSNTAGYTCEGDIELYDRDTDDALGLLDCALTHYPQADPARVAAAGWSRGAQIVMRAGSRDPRIGGVISLAGWTNEWAVSGQSYAYYKLPELIDEPLDLTNLLYNYDHKLWELRYGFCDRWAMRQVFLRMSVAYSAATMPAIQVHQGAQDPGIDLSQGESIAAWLEWEGHTDYEYYLYPDGTHAPNSYPGAPASTRIFLAAIAAE